MFVTKEEFKNLNVKEVFESGKKLYKNHRWKTCNILGKR